MSYTEKDFEDIIVNHFVNVNNYELATNSDFDKNYAIDTKRLFHFINDTQSTIMNELYLNDDKNNFLDELSRQLSTKGIIKLFHNGFIKQPARK